MFKFTDKRAERRDKQSITLFAKRFSERTDNGRDETSGECEQKFLNIINFTLGLSDTHHISALHSQEAPEK